MARYHQILVGRDHVSGHAALIGETMESVAAYAFCHVARVVARMPEQLRARMRWNAVSKQATCGNAGLSSMAVRIDARLCG